MRAKTFFYVCAGVFLLALSYHLGARSVVAQTMGLDGANITQGTVTAADGRTFRVMTGPTPGTLPDVIPGTARVISTGTLPDQYWQYGALLENGDFYRFAFSAPGGVSGWQYVGNLLSGATPAQRESFGALKSRYRGEHAAQPTQGR